jgi:polysaccharide deacetylase 2 family uncharacterized protein YibQ
VARKSNRPLVLALLIAVAVVAGGYGLSLIKNDALPPSTVSRQRQVGEKEGAAKPWYKNQPPPPELVRAEAQSVFPETSKNPPGDARRAYEEALPKEIYNPSTVPGGEKKKAAAPPTAKESLPRWKKYAVKIAVLPNKPKIALVIDDLGLDRPRTRRAVGLNGPLTLSFLPYAGDLKRQTAAAKKAGHELFLHISMEPGGTAVDPGPNALLTGLGGKELLRRLRWALGSFKGYVGVNNHMGSKFTQDRQGMALVLGELGRRGLAFLDSRTSAKTLGAELARRMGVPYAERNIFIDNDGDPAAIRARLGETERFARKNGVAIAIGHPREITLDVLEPWLRGIKAKGFQLVPLSAVLRTPLTFQFLEGARWDGK